MLDIVKIRFKIPFYSRITANNKAQLRDFSVFTDDSVMTLAVAQWLMEDEAHTTLGLIQRMKELGKRYPNAGYGGRFSLWLMSTSPMPYNSWGNGSGMRVSPVGLYAKTIDDALAFFWDFYTIAASEKEEGAVWLSSSALLTEIKRRAGASMQPPTVNKFSRELRNIPEIQVRRGHGSDLYLVRPI